MGIDENVPQGSVTAGPRNQNVLRVSNRGPLWESTKTFAILEWGNDHPAPCEAPARPQLNCALEYY